LYLQFNDTLGNTFGTLVGYDICITSSPKFHVNGTLDRNTKDFHILAMNLTSYYCSIFFSAPRVPHSNYGAT